MANQLKKLWVCLFYKDKNLLSYDRTNTYPGELEATKELLAEEKDIPKQDIKAYLCQKNKDDYLKLGEIIFENAGYLNVVPFKEVPESQLLCTDLG